MGGLARRAGFERALVLRSHGDVPVLSVDAGNLFSDDRYIAGQLPAEVSTRDKWVLKAYGDFGEDAANVSYNDLPYLATILRKDGLDQRIKDYPFIKRLIAANIKPPDGVEPLAPYVIREVTLKRGEPGKTFRIGILGLTAGRPGANNSEDTDIAGFHIDDPLETAKRVIPQLKKQADYIIALAYMTKDKAEALANQNPEIDTIIGAHGISDLGDPQHFDKATITYAYSQTKYVGELLVYLKGNGQIDNQLNRFVSLDDSIPDDPAAADEVANAHTEFTSEQDKGAAAAQAAGTPMSLLNTASPYAGAETCAKCHQHEYDIWKNTGHSHAMATLEKRNQQFDQTCVKCHVVGYGSGGFQALYSTPQFANVQCESCHGPGKAHADNPSKGYGFMPIPAGCIQCHTRDNSPDFNFAVYYPKVKHEAAN